MKEAKLVTWLRQDSGLPSLITGRELQDTSSKDQLQARALITRVELPGLALCCQ